MTTISPNQTDCLQDRYGRRVAARLTDSTDTLPHDITERLRAARVRAVSHRKIARVQSAPAIQVSGGGATLGFDTEGLNLWSRLASALPIVALVIGLAGIAQYQRDDRAQELADVDAALLVDDLPPAAYTDAGFAQYLKIASLTPVTGSHQQP